MTFYEFSNDYLILQTQKYLPDFSINELEHYRTPHIYSWPPYFAARRGSEQKNDIMKMLAFILQNRFNLPNVINFENNYDVLSAVTNQFDADIVANFDKDVLIQELAEEINFDSSSRSWNNYAQGLIDAAKYLEKIKNFSYDSYLKYAESNPDTVINELCQIKGMGPALARNFLKEIGVTQFGKPDVHLYAVFESFDSSVVNETTFDSALTQQASKANVSSFELDRIIWLICSGNYFKHHIKIGKRTLRDNFIKELTEAIDKGVVTV